MASMSTGDTTVIRVNKTNNIVQHDSDASQKNFKSTRVAKAVLTASFVAILTPKAVFLLMVIRALAVEEKITLRKYAIAKPKQKKVNNSFLGIIDASPSKVLDFSNEVSHKGKTRSIEFKIETEAGTNCIATLHLYTMCKTNGSNSRFVILHDYLMLQKHLVIATTNIIMIILYV